MVEFDVGAVVVATGYELYSMKNFPEYGGGRYKNVINGLQFERMLSASGPTQGEVRRPSDGRIPKRVAFVSCIGSRDPEHHMPYCSKVCCVYNVKHAMLYKEHIRDGEAFVFSIDVRTAGKGYEEFLLRGKRDEKIIYIRGKPGRIIQEKDDLEVWVTDTFTAHRMRIKFDMVVLAMALIPSAGALNLSKVLRIQADQHGFFSEAHPKLRPVESLVAGFFLAGCAQAPKDIPDTVAQASAAASKVVEMFNKKELLAEPYVAFVDEKLCAGCRVCVAVCPYSARVYADDKKVVTVNEALCQGCGACTVACSSGAAQMKNLKDKQLMKMVEVVCRD
jgi:heterodisulfide reductase subunit A